MSSRTLSLVMIALLAASAGAWVARGNFSATPVLASGTWLPSPRIIPDVPLYDETGASRDASVWRGAPNLIFFGFTHCPDICPATLGVMATLARQQPVEGLHLTFVSVDPERDNPLALARYVGAFSSGLPAGTWRGLSGPETSLQVLTRKLGVAAGRVDLPGGGYTVDHSATLYLTNSDGAVVAIFTPPFSVERLAADLRTARRAVLR